MEIEKGCVLERGLPDGFVITDRSVFEKYGHLIKGKKFVIKPGEKSKVLEVYGEILNNLGDSKRIIAFGGGVVGDLAGFVASTYKRGVDFIQIPTTLLAMVDSSVGGKTGINLGEKKNYVGTFYPASEVLIDPLFLEDLPEEEFRNGVAEIVKCGLVFRTPSLERLGDGVCWDDEDLSEIISQCVNCKIKVVEEDLFDKGVRRTLNFGHTAGHAGMNGFSYEYLKELLGDVEYLAVEAAGQEVEHMNEYFFENKFVGRAIVGDLFKIEEMKSLLNSEKRPRIVFLFQVIDALENLERNFSKKFISEISEECEKIVLTLPTESLGGRKKFTVQRKWIMDFLEENFIIEKDFKMNGERVIVVHK